MSAALHKLTPKEQEVFDFLKDYQKFIKELADVFEMVHKVLKIIKNEGLSYANIEKCLNLIQQYGLKIPTVLTTKIKQPSGMPLQMLLNQCLGSLNKEQRQTNQMASPHWYYHWVYMSSFNTQIRNCKTKLKAH